MVSFGFGQCSAHSAPDTAQHCWCWTVLAPETAAGAGQSLRLLSCLLSGLLSANHPKSLHRHVRRPSQAFYPHQGTLLTPSDSCRAEDPLASSDGQMAASKSGPAYDGGDDGTLLSEKSDRDDPDVPVAEATAVDRRQTFLETSSSTLH